MEHPAALLGVQPGEGGEGDGATMKPCKGCGETKLLEAFHRDKNRRDGRRSACKDCVNPSGAATRARRAERDALASDGLKRCSGCEEVKPRESFHRDRSARDGLDYRCVSCASPSAAAYREARREAGLLERAGLKTCRECEETKPLSDFYSRDPGGLRGECKECTRDKAKLYQEKKPDVHSAAAKRWIEKPGNREKRNAGSREWAKRNRERVNAVRYAAPNFQEMQRQHRHTRLARLARVGGKWTAVEFAALCEFYGDVCLCCGDAAPLTFDHVVPLSKGGGNTITNAQPLCGPCNSRKGNRSATDYRDPERHAEFMALLGVAMP